VRVVFGVAARDATRLAGLAGPGDTAAQLAEHVRERISLRSGTRECELREDPAPLASSPGFLRIELRLRCPEAGRLRIRIATFFDVAPGHVHFARVRGGGTGAEYLFTESRPEVELGQLDGRPAAGSGTSLAGYVQLGIEHIASGIDHLAFLLVLMLLCERLREVVWIATGFSLGHSLTLALAVLGWVRPEQRLVEALIGFTIALVAAENIAVRAGISRLVGRALGLGLGALALVAMRGDETLALALAGLALFAVCYMHLIDAPERARQLRPAVTFAFGLVHGLGFAGQLLAVGVPADRLLAALLGFNLGVELGQIAVIAALWSFAAVVLARWRDFPRARAVDVASAALCALGLYWFGLRAYG
jgi:hypothetical protein